MHKASQIARQIARWDLVTLDQTVIDRPSADPADDVVRKVMVRRNSGVRGGRYRNRRIFVTTSRELLKVPNGDKILAHPHYPLSAI